MPVTVLPVDEEPLVRVERRPVPGTGSAIEVDEPQEILVVQRAWLTEREAEVPRPTARGMPNAEIAVRPVPGTEAVGSRAVAVPAHLGARNRTQAVITAYRRGSSRRGERAPVDIGTDSLLAGVRPAEYDPPNTRTSWKDGRWGS
ncbi:hypothetical protein ASD48_36100 [Streptomyces sp. Root1310]|nr:hypothetical protein ASD48_36100 [Streptomyces sp. Root1310]